MLHELDRAARSSSARSARRRRRDRLRRADEGLGVAPQPADDRHLPLRHPPGRHAATSSARSTVRDDDGYIAQRRPQPKFFRLAYLVTAWTQRAEDEHRLLSALLVTFLRHETVPTDLLDGLARRPRHQHPARRRAAAAAGPRRCRTCGRRSAASSSRRSTSASSPRCCPSASPRPARPSQVEPVLTVVDRAPAPARRIGGRPMPDDRRRASLADRRPPPPPTRRPRAEPVRGRDPER